MGWGAARKLRQVVVNVRTVLAVELLCAAQGIELRAGTAGPAAATGAVLARVRREIAFMAADREVAPQIASVDALLPELRHAAEQVVGPLR
jgi:histidine ammonia-lyase